MDVSRERRREIIAALRKGTVPQRGLDFLAVGLGHFQPVISSELADVAQGGTAFKAVRGDYGCGKTFFGRWVQEYAKKHGFATAEVQISETETPLHRLAEKSGISVKTIQNWEIDRNSPRMDALVRLAEALGTTLDLLVIHRL